MVAAAQPARVGSPNSMAIVSVSRRYLCSSLTYERQLHSILARKVPTRCVTTIVMISTGGPFLIRWLGCHPADDRNLQSFQKRCLAFVNGMLTMSGSTTQLIQAQCYVSGSAFYTAIGCDKISGGGCITSRRSTDHNTCKVNLSTA